MPILDDIERPGVSEWRTKILEKLREKADGDYFTLSNDLDTISNVHLAEDINEVGSAIWATSV